MSTAVLCKIEGMERRILTAARRFAECYEVGEVGPNQRPPGIEANAKLRVLKEAIQDLDGFVAGLKLP
jgi:hypothetical protein